MRQTLLVVLLLCGCARAQENWLNFEGSGNAFLAACTGEGHNVHVEAMCFAYIDGVMDGLTLAKIKPDGSGVDYCLPRTATRQQIFDVVVKWIKEHPEDRDILASALIKRAVIKTFPCYGSR
jgi:hypothetical protein